MFEYMVRNLIFIVAVFLVSSCHQETCPGDAKAFMSEYRQLLHDVSTLDRYISSKQWEPYDQRFEHLILSCYPPVEPQLTDSLQRSVWLDAISFAMARHRYDVQKIIQDTTEQTLVVIREHMRTLWDNPYSAFEEIFRRQTGEEFQDALKEVKGDTSGQ